MDRISSLITLIFPDARPDLATLPEINAALARYGARLWPIDLAAADGTGVDEILQLLSGGKIRVLLQIKHEGLVTFSLAADNSTGWIVTYDGGHPHIGSLTGGTPGTKLLAQVIGPAEWIVRYQENANQ